MFPAYFIQPWPWPLTFWLQMLTHPSLSHNASLMQVWWKCVKYSARYRVNVSGRTHGRTDARTHAWTSLDEQDKYASGHTTLGEGTTMLLLLLIIIIILVSYHKQRWQPCTSRALILRIHPPLNGGAAFIWVTNYSWLHSISLVYQRRTSEYSSSSVFYRLEYDICKTTAPKHCMNTLKRQHKNC